MTLPFSRSLEGPGACVADSSEPFRYSVLVVAPELDDRIRAYQELDRQGFRVATSACGLDALKYAARSRPRVVVLDWTLPDLTGPTMLAALRETIPDAPIVMLGDPDRDSVRGNVVEILGKPLDPESLSEAVHRATCLVESATPIFCQVGNGRHRALSASLN